MQSKMLEQQPFWQHLDFTQQSLIKQSFYLLNWAKTNKQLYDYSFIVMPAAKAFEGFLKKLFFDQGLITLHDYSEEYFRIGKALNPELSHKRNFIHDSIYEKISQKCGSEIAQTLWYAWKECRNQVFHYFVKRKQTFTLDEAEGKLNQLVQAMNMVCKTCYEKI